MASNSQFSSRNFSCSGWRTNGRCAWRTSERCPGMIKNQNHGRADPPQIVRINMGEACSLESKIMPADFHPCHCLLKVFGAAGNRAGAENEQTRPWNPPETWNLELETPALITSACWKSLPSR